MRKTGDKCGFTQVYASLIAACFMTALPASFLSVVAGEIVGRTLGWTSKRPQQHLSGEWSCRTEEQAVA